MSFYCDTFLAFYLNIVCKHIVFDVGPTLLKSLCTLVSLKIVFIKKQGRFLWSRKLNTHRDLSIDILLLNHSGLSMHSVKFIIFENSGMMNDKKVCANLMLFVAQPHWNCLDFFLLVHSVQPGNSGPAHCPKSCTSEGCRNSF